MPKVLIQWARQNPGDWEELDVAATGSRARAWRDLPKRPEPLLGQLGGQDDEPGHVFDLCVQGVTFGGYDHYAIDPIADDGLRVIAWNTDPDDFAPDELMGIVWTFLPPAPDDRFGGRVNTRQWQTRYHGPATAQPDAVTSGGPVGHRSWHEFVPPVAPLTRHGIWVPGDLHAEHMRVRRAVHWREWVT